MDNGQRRTDIGEGITDNGQRIYSPNLNIEESELISLQERLGYEFRRRDLLIRSLTHKSFAHEARQPEMCDNETFEFLGDSVLGFVIGDLLFHRFPDMDEGALSKMKAYLVSAPILSEKSRRYGIGDSLFLGVGEAKSGGRNKDSLLANVFEALVAGVYLDGGVDPVRKLIETAFGPDLDAIDREDLLFHDYKTALQELAQGQGHPLPEYSVLDELGPDHDKRFVVEVKLSNVLMARGEGSSKKEAQQQAAKEALRRYQERNPVPQNG